MNNTSSSGAPPPPADTLEQVKQFYRHYFNKPNPHEIAEIRPVLKKIDEAEGIEAHKRLELVKRAFERCVQEGPKKCTTFELLRRIDWKIQDYHTEKAKEEAARKKRETISPPVHTRSYNPDKDGSLFQSFKMFDDKAEHENAEGKSQRRKNIEREFNEELKKQAAR